METQFLLDILRSFKNHQKKRKNDQIHNFQPISASKIIRPSKVLIEKYHRCVRWEKTSIHPILPYSLLTDLHFHLVNSPHFCFSPFGLIHKQEEIFVSKELSMGDWLLQATIPKISSNGNGYEFFIETVLTIDGIKCWESKTLALRRHKSTQKKGAQFLSKNRSGELLTLNKKLGRQYGWISKNLDPIHMSKFTANLFGHKKMILHGMWSVARGVSEFEDQLKTPFSIETQFKSPIYLPCQVLLVKDKSTFSFFSDGGKKCFLISKFY